MNRKIRLLAVLLSVCMIAGVFAACGGTDNSSVAAQDVYSDLVAEVTFPEMLPLDSDGLFSLVGIESDLYTEAVAYIPLTAVSGNMIFIVKVADETSADAVAQKLENYRLSVLAQMNNYIPAEYDKINAASVETDGSFVWLVVADDQAAAVASVEANLN